MNAGSNINIRATNASHAHDSSLALILVRSCVGVGLAREGKGGGCGGWWIGGRAAAAAAAVASVRQTASFCLQLRL